MSRDNKFVLFLNAQTVQKIPCALSSPFIPYNGCIGGREGAVPNSSMSGHKHLENVVYSTKLAS